MVRSGYVRPFAIARLVVEIFFPQRPALGLDQRCFSPTAVDKIVSGNAEHKSAKKTQKMLAKQAEISVSVSVISELTATIGMELSEHQKEQAVKNTLGELQPEYRETPNVVAIGTDGGRIMTRAVGGRGVHDEAWKETKNASFHSFSSSESLDDPHPELPSCFTDKQYVERIVNEIHSRHQTLENTGEDAVHAMVDAAIEEATRDVQDNKTKPDWRPKRLMRTAISSMCCSSEFGPLVAAEAQRRGFYQASRRAFLGDGQAWNWSIHQQHFPDFTGITDFIHPLGYIHVAAKAMAGEDAWLNYLEAVTKVWQGQVAQVIDELQNWLIDSDTDPKKTKEARETVQQALTYLTNNRQRMNYPEYRKKGLPTSTALTESLIKEINYRVKGTEKFWNRPEGAEYILHVKAAALCDDDRLSRWIMDRTGSYFYRPTTGQQLAEAA